MDLKFAYLDAPFGDKIYSRQPPDSEIADVRTHWLKLYEAVYGLKQAGYELDMLLYKSLPTFGWKALNCDSCL